MISNELILGAVGILQFEVVAYRLKREYNVEAIFENVETRTAYWVDADDAKKMQQFRNKNETYLAEDAHGHLVYLAPSMVNLQLAQERHPDIRFHNTTETLKPQE